MYIVMSFGDRLRHIENNDCICTAGHLLYIVIFGNDTKKNTGMVYSMLL
jgi:hypothetical protein